MDEMGIKMENKSILIWDDILTYSTDYIKDLLKYKEAGLKNLELEVKELKYLLKEKKKQQSRNTT
jgi:hypothetical protein